MLEQSLVLTLDQSKAEDCVEVEYGVDTQSVHFGLIHNLKLNSTALKHIFVKHNWAQV